MHKYERQTILISFLEQQDFIPTKKLIALVRQKHHFSEITLRRDLKEIAKNGKISLLHGGIKLIKSPPSPPSPSNISKNKLLFAEKIIDLIQDNEIIFLNDGLINSYLVKIIEKPVSIVTNSLTIFNLATTNKHILNLILIGGCYLKNQNVLVGNYSLKIINDLKFSRCILNATSISSDYNLYAKTESEAQIKKQILSNSKIKILVSEKENLNTIGFSKYANVTECDIFITDDATITQNKTINSLIIN